MNVIYKSLFLSSLIILLGYIIVVKGLDLESLNDIYIKLVMFIFL